MALAGLLANRDYYRKHKFNESVWPFLPSVLGKWWAVLGVFVVIGVAAWRLAPTLMGTPSCSDAAVLHQLGQEGFDGLTGITTVSSNDETRTVSCTGVIWDSSGIPIGVTYTAQITDDRQLLVKYQVSLP